MRDPVTDQIVAIRSEIGVPRPIAHAGDSVRVLVVDDDVAQAEALAELLAYDTAITSTAVGNSELAMKQAAATQPDIAIIDCLMAGLDGVHALQLLRETTSRVHGILYTGLPKSDTRVLEFLAFPKTVYLAKGSRLKDMVALISELQGAS